MGHVVTHCNMAHVAKHYVAGAAISDSDGCRTRDLTTREAAGLLFASAGRRVASS